ncbi:MAG: outer membrane beta-barrel protein [Elusimicrobiota bacterium]
MRRLKSLVRRLLGGVLLVPLALSRAGAGLFYVDVRTSTEKFELRLPRSANYELVSGSLNFTVPDGVRMTVLSGQATMMVEGTAIVGDAGDTFSFLIADGRAHIVVHAGEMSVTLPGYMTAVIRAGQFLPVRVSKFGTVTAPQAPQVKAPQVKAPQAKAPRTRPPIVPGPPARKPSVRTPGINLNIRLYPYYAVTQSYDTNIYRVPRDKADAGTVGGGVLGSWITRNTVGSRLQIPFNKQHRFGAGYALSIENYSTQPGVNDTNDQQFDALYRYDMRRRVVLQLADKYKNTKDPAFSSLVERKRRYENEVSALLDYGRSRLFVWAIDAHFNHHKYLDPMLSSLLNRYESSFGGRVGIRLQPHSELYLHYHRGIVHYSAGRADHSKSHDLGLGLSGELAPRLKGMVSSGVAVRRYERATGEERQTVSLLTTAVDLKYELSRRTRFALVGYRRMQESTFGGSRYYVATGATLNVRQRIKALVVSVSGGHETSVYPVSTTIGAAAAFRRDRHYTGSVRIDYELRKWLSLSAQYTSMQRLTSFAEEFDYRADVTSVGLRAGFGGHEPNRRYAEPASSNSAF